MTTILTEWDKRKLLDNRRLAYMLATAFHETGGKMQPLRENMNYTSSAQIEKTWPTLSFRGQRPTARSQRTRLGKQGLWRSDGEYRPGRWLAIVAMGRL